MEWQSLLLLHNIKLELWMVISTLSSQKRLEMSQNFVQFNPHL